MYLAMCPRYKTSHTKRMLFIGCTRIYIYALYRRLLRFMRSILMLIVTVEMYSLNLRFACQCPSRKQLNGYAHLYT